MQAKYDKLAQGYDALNISADSQLSILDLAYLSLIQQVASVEGKTLLELGCGTGTLALHWAQTAARVIALDISSEMLAQAKIKAGADAVTWIQDDAQSLSQIADNHCDIVSSNFALMDIPDLQAVLRSVRRVLKTGGRFVFTITHPCFQSPQAEMMHSDTQFDGRLIRQYASEGHWKSTHVTGIRGQVGAHHRTLSTYINSLIAVGFTIAHISEPTLDTESPDNPYREMMFRIPSIMLIDASLEK